MKRGSRELTAIKLDINNLHELFPEPWSERLRVQRYNESTLAEMQAHFEENWYQQIDQSINLEASHLAALIDLAATVWEDDGLRHYALICGHFFFNASERELQAFTWPQEILQRLNVKSSGLFYLLCYLSRFDQAISVYREQRISLDTFNQTANRISHLIKSDDSGAYYFEEHGLLAWLCQGKIVNIGGLIYLPDRWNERVAIWRNGLDASLREEVLADTDGTDPLSLAQTAKAHCLDLNVWQLKLKPADKVLKIVAMKEGIEESDILHSLNIADRFYKDSDHFYNFVAYDFRSCLNVNHAFVDKLILREE